MDHHILQIILILINTILLAFGISMIVLGLYFISGFHMARLYFLDYWLYIFPVSVSTIGLFLALASVLGVVFSGLKNKYGLIGYSVLMGALVLPQFFTTYASSQVKQATDERAFVNHFRVGIKY